jgi:phosphoglycerate dehydrogenase-like enzyme
LDEAALIEALRTGRIAGAGLDVFAVEPLPADSPFWDMANVMVTPRVGGMSDTYAQQALPLVEHNLRAFLAGDLSAMRNIVERSAP